MGERVKHLIKFAENVDGKWIYRFPNHPRFSYWAFNMIQRKQTLQRSGIFLKQNPGDAHLTIDELREMAASFNNSNAFISKISRYVANIGGSNYWYKVREELKAIVTSVGTPTFFFTFSLSDMHWPDLHAVFGNDNATTEERQIAVINNPQIVDWFFTQRLKILLSNGCTKHLMPKGIGIDLNTIHCHGTAILKNDPGLCHLTKTALKVS